MKELQRKQYLKQLMYSWPSIFVMAIVAFFLAKGAAGLMFKERESARRVADLEQQSESLKIRQSELEQNIARLKTEEGVVEEIKEKFSVTRKDEHVAIIVDETLATNTEKTAGDRIMGWWQSLKNLWTK